MRSRDWRGDRAREVAGELNPPRAKISSLVFYYRVWSRVLMIF